MKIKMMGETVIAIIGYVCMIIQKGINMMVNGNKIKRMEKEFNNFQTDLDMMVNGWMINIMELELTIIVMGIN